jgi:hypothetical protein
MATTLQEQFTNAHAKHPPMPIGKSIGQNLPDLNRSGDPGDLYKSVKASGKTTSKASPPRFLLCRTRNDYSVIAEDICERYKNHDFLKNYTVAANFNNMSLNTETDVNNATQNFLIAPLNHILHGLFGEGWSHKAENNPPGGTENIRFDISYTCPDTSLPGMKDKVIAIVELKRRDMCRYKQHKSALLHEDATPSEKADFALKAVRQNSKTLLQGNAVAYMKQICTYAAKAECQHVALFNWDYLQIYEFKLAALKPGARFTAGTTAILTWFSENAPKLDEKFILQCPFRAALLGWLIMCFEAAGFKRLP